MSIAFRTRLTRYIHDLYLNDYLDYYKLLNLDGGIGQGVDQFICNDLTLFTDAAASLYSSIGKPLVDLCVFNYQLSHSLGPLALSAILTNYFITATALRRLSPPFGKLKAVEGRREGDFRGLHARLIANAEEVAFYGGADMEKVFLDKSFKDLKSWMEGIYRLKIRYNMLEDFVLKYSWSAFGYLITSLPVFLPEWGGLGSTSPSPSSSSSESQDPSRSRMQAFITNKRLMLSLADAGGRMMYSIKDLSELAGYTSRVYALISTLHRVHAAAYYPPRGTRPEPYSLADVDGIVQRGYDGVRLESVPLIAPAVFPHSGTPLLSNSLNFTLPAGAHTLITGPNGAGKSAIARLLAGLWPTYRGLVSRPRRPGGIIFLPQRPYLPIGTLRDQIIYPSREMDMRDSGATDADLQKILDEVHLGYLTEREGGFDARKEWKDVLSGGEKQRMGFARVRWGKPGWVVADEATSAVSADVEGVLYEKCKEWGATLVIISTRVSLKKYCRFSLTLHGLEGVGAEERSVSEDEAGQGNGEQEWSFERIGTEEERGGVQREIGELREVLGKVDGWRKRREEIEQELGRVWVHDGEKGERRELEKPGYVTDVSDEVEWENEG